MRALYLATGHPNVGFSAVSRTSIARMQNNTEPIRPNITTEPAVSMVLMALSSAASLYGGLLCSRGCGRSGRRWCRSSGRFRIQQAQFPIDQPGLFGNTHAVPLVGGMVPHGIGGGNLKSALLHSDFPPGKSLILLRMNPHQHSDHKTRRAHDFAVRQDR